MWFADCITPECGWGIYSSNEQLIRDGAREHEHERGHRVKIEQDGPAPKKEFVIGDSWQEELRDQ